MERPAGMVLANVSHSWTISSRLCLMNALNFMGAHEQSKVPKWPTDPESVKRPAVHAALRRVRCLARNCCIGGAPMSDYTTATGHDTTTVQIADGNQVRYW